MAAWEKYYKPKEDGTIVEMQAPLIVSASRSTDIPAFYADWFFDRLQKGYSAWTNPFNGKKYYVSYENCRFIVFWSKNPRPLLKYLPLLKERNIKCYVQYSLNDYEKEKLEKVPPLANRIETFKLLYEELGMGGIIWRFDPLILTDDITIGNLLDKIQNIGDQLQGYTEKLVFSFADIEGYKKVKSNLQNSGIPYHEWEYEEMNDFVERLVAMNKERGWNYQLATCGENFDALGISRNRCIDGDLIVRRAWNDKKLMEFMKVKIEDVPAPSLFGDSELPEGAILLPENHYFISKHRKDMGQRPFCECMASKDIGEYNTCVHLCEYCYANTNKQTAVLNFNCHKNNPWSETITGK